MQIIQDPTSLNPCVLVLGMFDGVHLGHQALLAQGRQLSKDHHLPLTVCTFEPHPLAIVAPDRVPPRLTTPEERAVWMDHYGADVLCVMGFTAAFAAQTPEAFVRQMAEIYHPRFVVTGFNFTFGDRGAGTTETLHALQSAYGYETITVPAVTMEDAPVSSTRIRKLLQAGDFDRALALLGHPYTMEGQVVHGKQLGRTLGFPTANVAVSPHKVLPAYGVYLCTFHIQGDPQDHPAMVNVGRHPTVPEGQVTVEAHLLDADLPLYGKDVTLSFLSYRRPEHTFANVAELQKQLRLDQADANSYFGI